MQLPLGLLNAAVGGPISIELKSQETLNGTLVACDNWMNLTLREVTHTSADGERFTALTEAYARGNNIKYLRMPDAVIDKVKEQQQREQAQRGGRGGAQRGDMGGRGDRGRGMGRGGRAGRGRGRGA
ncbi:Sm-like ribonucleoprotein [Saccharata proteae CBS 121410]|uniref:LSM complex subunit LSM4 n=1 Tax=Saccharata proteae CBS 121410 TaxID=1314787 RepID=A0A6A5YCY6_9PEZI|nr:Sm-like ribonucleoprotein [Saccharata proteae CBS 121410]